MQGEGMDMLRESNIQGEVTILELQKMKRLYDSGMTYERIGKELNRAGSTVAKWLQRTGRNARIPKEKPRKLYSVYLRKTDEIVAFGTARECAARLGMTLSSFYPTVSRSQSGQQRKYEIISEEIGGDDDEVRVVPR